MGHHANFCQNVLQEFRRRGIPVLAYGHSRLSEHLKEKLGVTPLFLWNTYYAQAEKNTEREDPIHGWLKTFELSWHHTYNDLLRLGPVRTDDLVFLNSALPPQFMALVQWLGQAQPKDWPQVVMEIHVDPGIDPNLKTLSPNDLPDPRIRPRPLLNRYIASYLVNSEAQDKFRILTFERDAAPAFQLLMNYPVEACPLPFSPVTTCRNRVGQKAFTVSVLGHQRLEKGYELVPDIAAALLTARSDVAFLAHNGEPSQLPGIQGKLRALAAREPRLILNELTAGRELWASLLEISDLIICPYHHEIFSHKYSAVAAEAIANGIPIVYPANSSLSKMVEESGGGGVAFESFDAGLVTKAALQVLNNFDHYADQAQRGSKTWLKRHGSDAFVDRLLSPNPSAQQAPVPEPVQALFA